MRCGIREWEDFLKSHIWQDMNEEYIQWLADLHSLLEDSAGGTPDKTLHRAGGAAEAVRNMLKMPSIMIENLTQDAEREEEDD